MIKKEKHQITEMVRLFKYRKGVHCPGKPPCKKIRHQMGIALALVVSCTVKNGNLTNLLKSVKSKVPVDPGFPYRRALLCKVRRMNQKMIIFTAL